MSRQYDHRGRDQINIEEVRGNVLIQGQEPPTRVWEERVLLQKVDDEVVSRLEQSLHHAVLINLAKETQPEKVNRPWEQELRIGVKPATLLPADQTIAQVFDHPEIRGKLLILGKPGAGKTTTLLDLAKVLVERADADVHQPIPILLNLSSWKDDKQPIQDWAIAELHSKYGVSRKLGQKWLTERKLLPLLDGLDEVAPERQNRCVIRINEFLRSETSPLYVVVCSRLEEYENLTDQIELHGAICLKELADEQIQAYLTNLDRPLLWQMLSQNPDLRDLVRAPLLLSITILAFPQDSEKQWQQFQHSRDPLQFLLDTYVERMLHRQFKSQAYGKRKQPTAKETRSWLIWLAQQMEINSQTEFLVEELQPSMLLMKKKWLYQLSFGLTTGLTTGLITGVIVGLIWGLSRGLIAALTFGLFFGLTVGFASERREYLATVEKLGWSWKSFLLDGTQSIGLPFGFFIGLYFAQNGRPAFGVFSGVLFWLFFALTVGLNRETVERRMSPNQGIRRSAKISLIVGLLSGVFYLLILGLIFNPSVGVIVGIVFGVFSWAYFGGGACIQHLSLRLLLFQSRCIPWNYARFLDYCTERLFLQRVGGRYRFMHKLLQEHFAHMPQKSVE